MIRVRVHRDVVVTVWARRPYVRLTNHLSSGTFRHGLPVILFAHHPGSWVPYYGLRGDRERVLAPRYKEVGAIPEEAAGGQLVDVLYQPLVVLEMARAPRRGLSRSNILELRRGP